MATYGLSVYGSTLYGGGSRAPFAPPGTFGGGLEYNGPFQVHAQPVGHGTIEVTWVPTSDSTLTLLRLVRSLVGYPVQPDDGEVLMDLSSVTDALNYIDTDVRAGVRYYYGIFVYSSTLQSWLRAGTTTGLATGNTDTGARLYQVLPAMYQVADMGQSGFLQRFMELLGHQADILRTEISSLGTITDPATGHALGTQLALEQYGFTPEPELGFAAMRQLLSIATDLYQSKGTMGCLRLLSQAVTGWVTTMGVGPNIMLDDEDSNFAGSEGRWTPLVGSANYRLSDTGVAAPDSIGMLQIFNTAGGSAVATFVPQPGVTALTQGIPISPTVLYDVSMNVRGDPVAVQLQMDWYDSAGASISSVLGAAVTPDPSDWNVAATVSAEAPVNASRLGLRLITGVLSTSQIIYASQCMVSIDPAPSAYVPARQIEFELHANLINEIPNPRFATNTAGWTATGGTIAAVTGVIDGPPVAPNSYGTYTATGAKQGLTTSTVTFVPGNALFSVSFWVRTTLAGITATLSSADGTVTPVTVTSLPHTGTWQQVNLSLLTADAYDALTLTIATPSAGVYSIGGVILNAGDPAQYFDGSFPSATADYLWEGNPNDSRSHYYRQRTIRTARLRKLAPKFMPPALSFVFLFAQPRSTLPGAYGEGPYGEGLYGTGLGGGGI